MLTKTLIVGSAILGYGGWAVFSNWADHQAAQMIAWRAGCLQGSYAGVLTFINIWLLDRIYRWFLQKNTARISKSLTLLSVTFTQYSVVIPAHAFNDTPNILMTILPGLVIGTVFSYGYLSNIYPNSTPP